MKGFIPENVVDLINRYITGDNETKKAIQLAFPEIKWDDLSQQLFFRQLADMLGQKDEHLMKFRMGGLDFLITIQRK